MSSSTLPPIQDGTRNKRIPPAFRDVGILCLAEHGLTAEARAFTPSSWLYGETKKRGGSADDALSPPSMEQSTV